MTKPLVAIVADRKVLDLHAFHCVGEKYLNAVIDGAGCDVILLPALGERLDFERMLNLADGWLFTGSASMVDPKLYAGPTLPAGQNLDVQRDATTLPLMRKAVERGVPVFCICRGAQEMNVAWGGSLLQKVHETPGMLDHREDDSAPLAVQYAPAHEVHFRADGLLHKLIQADSYMVNSVHNQGVERLGAGLQIEATAPDGLIEAYSVCDARTFALAVQWHPEWQFQENRLSTAMFAAFGAACKQYQAAR